MKIQKRVALAVLLLASGCGGNSSPNASAPGNGAPNPTPGTGGSGPVQLSTDPFTDTIAQHQTAVEPSILAHGSTLVSAFQVGRIEGGASDAIGWATSKDGGATWSRGFLPGLTSDSGGTDIEVTDSVVAYDSAHSVWMVISLIFPTTGESSSAVVSRSSDGLTWSSPVTIASGTLDKDWVACDNGASSPYKGHCYAEWDDSSTQQIFMSVSSDGGLTWSPAQGSADSATGIGAQFAIRANGDVVMPFFNASTSSPEILSMTSTNGGQSWSSSAPIATPQTTSIPVRGETDPQVTIQPGGTIDVAWYDCRFETGCSANDVVMTSSTDGTAWSTPVKISPEAVGGRLNHFLPTIASDPSSGNLAQMYYSAPQGCSGTSCSATVWLSSSTNNGQSWTTPVALTAAFALNEVAKDPEGAMLGDYFSIAFSGGAAFPAYSAPVSPGASTLNQQIFTVAIPKI